MKLYRYVGPQHLAERALLSPPGAVVMSSNDVVAWVQSSGQQRDVDGYVIATFVVDESGILRVADRRSEHVVCAGGGRVRAAGEITFGLNAGLVTVVTASNQSTGYCPEPESWAAVAEALSTAGLVAPTGFSLVCEFRLCPSCESTNLIKNGVFECSVCGSELPAAYNYQCKE